MNKSGRFAKFTLHHYKIGFVNIGTYGCSFACNYPAKLYEKKQRALKVTKKEGSFFIGDKSYLYSDLEVKKIYFDWNSTSC